MYRLEDLYSTLPTLQIFDKRKHFLKRKRVNKTGCVNIFSYEILPSEIKNKIKNNYNIKKINYTLNIEEL